MIKQQLLSLLADGETVVPIPGTEFAVLWRSSMLAPDAYGGGRDARLTVVDLAPERELHAPQTPHSSFAT